MHAKRMNGSVCSAISSLSAPKLRANAVGSFLTESYRVRLQSGSRQAVTAGTAEPCVCHSSIETDSCGLSPPCLHDPMRQNLASHCPIGSMRQNLAPHFPLVQCARILHLISPWFSAPESRIPLQSPESWPPTGRTASRPPYRRSIRPRHPHRFPPSPYSP